MANIGNNSPVYKLTDLRFYIINGDQKPPEGIRLTKPSLYLAVDQKVLYYVSMAGQRFAMNLMSVEWGRLIGNILNQTDLVDYIRNQISTVAGVASVTSTAGLVDNTDPKNPKIVADQNKVSKLSEPVVPGNYYRTTINSDGLVTAGQTALTTEDITDFAAVLQALLINYQAIANRDTEVLEILAENNHYPTTKAVYDYGQAIIASIPTSGLNIPTELSLESNLPSYIDPESPDFPPGHINPELGDYYFIQNMDETKPGHTGRAWWSNDSETIDPDTQQIIGWHKIYDDYLQPDNSTISQNAAGQLRVDPTYIANYLDKTAQANQTIAGPLTLASTFNVNGQTTFGAEPLLNTAKTTPITNDGTIFATEAQVYATAQSLSCPISLHITTATIAANATTNIVHSIGSKAIKVDFFDANDTQQVYFDWVNTDENTIAVTSSALFDFSAKVYIYTQTA